MRKKSCGVLVVDGRPVQKFLLMVHQDRLDLPKGHMEQGETEIETALRELEEETGIEAQQIEVDPEFRFSTSYDVWDRKHGGQKCHKTTVIFLGYLMRSERTIRVTEHLGYQWRDWDPPHEIQPETIDPLLSQLERHLSVC